MLVKIGSSWVKKSDAQHMVWNDSAVVAALKWGNDRRRQTSL